MDIPEEVLPGGPHRFLDPLRSDFDDEAFDLCQVTGDAFLIGLVESTVVPDRDGLEDQVLQRGEDPGHHDVVVGLVVAPMTVLQHSLDGLHKRPEVFIDALVDMEQIPPALMGRALAIYGTTVQQDAGLVVLLVLFVVGIGICEPALGFSSDDHLCAGGNERIWVDQQGHDVLREVSVHDLLELPVEHQQSRVCSMHFAVWTLRGQEESGEP